MTCRNTFAAFPVAAFLAFMAPFARAAPPDDPCALLTSAQVSSALGVPVDAPIRTATIMKTCTWVQSGVSMVGGQSIQVILRTAGDHDKDKALMTQMGAMPKRGEDAPATIVTPVSGLGDDAFYTTMTPDPRTSLSVKKGSIGFSVAVQSAQIPLERQTAIEKTLAQQILARL